ncbi:hypothetical protein PAXRUDRAFT_10167 [Paxillus rubicundulus Ve08.2h10]|uniref:Uncharacterized protein n=1 Tax=Paxillus rubicundulus Ve08.2h10 TaxID=930991 RepID=A0A0D0E776_9AGAM|nr:hypothetical protein PAXRUDRAFT_10167 [Paxillus rubicundulus Ve08.2h10]
MSVMFQSVSPPPVSPGSPPSPTSSATCFDPPSGGNMTETEVKSSFRPHLFNNEEATDIFIHGIEALPDDILRAAIIEKYATAERSRHQLLLATWDLEETKRKVHTQEQIQLHLETSHTLNEAELKYWLSIYSDCGLPELREDELYYGHVIDSVTDVAREDATELSVMDDHAHFRGLDILGEVDDIIISDPATCDKVESDDELEELDEEPPHD